MPDHPRLGRAASCPVMAYFPTERPVGQVLANLDG
jgi:hypothetical protein